MISAVFRWASRRFARPFEGWTKALGLPGCTNLLTPSCTTLWLGLRESAASERLVAGQQPERPPVGGMRAKLSDLLYYMGTSSMRLIYHGDNGALRGPAGSCGREYLTHHPYDQKRGNEGRISKPFYRSWGDLPGRGPRSMGSRHIGPNLAREEKTGRGKNRGVRRTGREACLYQHG